MKTNITLSFNRQSLVKINHFLHKHTLALLIILLSVISVYYFIYYLNNGLGLNYNDARSHLDIGRRVVEGLKPGLAQLGSVWLPLNHALMIPLIWNDWAWHTGFAGAFWNMLSFVGTGIVIYKFLEKLKVGILGRVLGVGVFAANLNILYLQSTAMTEPLLLFTMITGCYYLFLWAGDKSILNLIYSSFWIMMSTLVRYDGWFLLLFSTAIVFVIGLRNRGYRVTEGLLVLFLTMGAFGIVLWLGWNLLIFNDPLYFAFGPFSAHAQQLQLEDAGNLATKGNLLLSFQYYFYALFYNSITLVAVMGFFGAIALFFDKKINWSKKLAVTALLAALIFNIVALYFGFSVLFIQGLSGNTWFNVRYGIMLLPAFGIFAGYLVHKLSFVRWPVIGFYLFAIFFAFANNDAVTIDDARVGASQKNVTEVADYLKNAAASQKGFILVSAASHDAIIFSSELPMKRFIHEGTGVYWDAATQNPENWARWIVMRTYDFNDLTYKTIGGLEAVTKYHLVANYPFADVYELDSQYLSDLNTEPTLVNKK